MFPGLKLLLILFDRDVQYGKNICLAPVFLAVMANHCQIKLKIKYFVVIFHWAIPNFFFGFLYFILDNMI